MRFYPRVPLKIHCWGGLGSQLFAYNLILDLSKRFPHRRIVLVFHSGGLTFREPEIDFLMVGIEFKLVNDFNIKTYENQVVRLSRFKRKPRFRVSGALKHLSLRVGLVARCNTDEEFQGLKSWVLDIRGHYTHRTIIGENLFDIERKASEAGLMVPKSPKVNSVLGIHYRLGDLITVTTKSPTAPEKIRVKTEELFSENPNIRVMVHSDSIEVAEESLGIFVKAKYLNLSAWDTICSLTQNQFFIGTNSKISEWVVVFRLYKKPDSISYLPPNFRKEVLRTTSLLGSADNFLDF
jgi:hypothetical protein